jgi:hypothetical protein
MSDGASFSILDKLADSSLPRLVSPAELRMFCNELDVHGEYQILAWKREGDHSDQVEIYITYPKKVR